MWVEPATCLGRNHRPFSATASKNVRDDLFRPAIAVDVGGIDEGHAGIERGIQRVAAVRFAHIAPGAADLPCAEADVRDRMGKVAERMLFHGNPPRDEMPRH